METKKALNKANSSLQQEYIERTNEAASEKRQYLLRGGASPSLTLTLALLLVVNPMDNHWKLLPRYNYCSLSILLCFIAKSTKFMSASRFQFFL